MNITVNAAKLRDTLAIASKCAMSKPTMPILGCLLLTASHKQQRLFVTSTNLDHSIRASVSAEVDADVTVALNSSMLVAIASKVDGETINLNVNAKSSAVKVTSASASFRLLGIPATEFPPFTPKAEGDPLVFTQAELLVRLHGASMSASTDATRYILNGVYVKCAGGTMTFVGTDGRRLHIFCGSTEAKQTVSAILPSQAVQRLAALLKYSGSAKLWLSERSATALVEREDGDIELVTKVVEGSYPNYQQVIPSRTEFLTLDSAILSAAVSRVAMVTNEKSASIKLELAGDVLTLSASSPDFGEAKETVTVANPKGLAGSVALNPVLFRDAIAGSAHDKLDFSIDPKAPDVSPVFIKAGDFRAVVMPVRLS